MSALPTHLQRAIESLKGKSKLERFGAVRELGKPENRQYHDAQEALITRNADTERDVRREVAVALGVVGERGNMKTLGVLNGMCEDRDPLVREAAVRAMVLVDCGCKESEADTWRPAGKGVRNVLTHRIIDEDAIVRAAAVEALAGAVEVGDGFAFELLLTGGHDPMTVMRHQSVPATPLDTSLDSSFSTPGVSDSPSIGTPTLRRDGSIGAYFGSPQLNKVGSFGSSFRSPGLLRGDSVGSSKFSSTGSLSSRRPDTAKSRQSDKQVTCDLHWSRMGQIREMEGNLVVCKPLHPPFRQDILLDEAVEGNIAVFVITRRISTALYYQAAFDAQRSGAQGVIFVANDPREQAAEEYELPEWLREGHEGAAELEEGFGERLEIGFAFVGEHSRGALIDQSYGWVYPDTTMRRAVLGDDSAQVRLAAFKTVCAISGCNDERFIQTFAEMLEDEDRLVRSACVEASSNDKYIKRGNPKAINALVEQTRNENWAVREAAIIAICRIQSMHDGECDPDGEMNNPVAIEALQERLYDEEGIVKKQAVSGLIQLALADGVIDEDDMPIIDTFVKALADPDPLVGTACAKALAHISHEGKEIAQAFSHMVDSRQGIRQDAVVSLGRAQPGNIVVLAMLKEKLNDADSPVRAVATRALANVALPGDEEVMRLLIGMCDDTNHPVRYAAVEGLQKVGVVDGKQFENVIDKLVDMSEDTESLVRQSAINGVAKVGYGHPNAVAGMKEKLKSNQHRTRKVALQTLPMLLEVGDKEILEGVLQCFQDPHTEVQKMACQVFSEHAEKAKEKGTVPSDLAERLAAITQQEDPLVAGVALESLHFVFDKGNRDAVMACVRCLRHESSTVRETAARVLGDMAIKGDERAIGYMLPLLDHSMGYVRFAAVTSLVKLGTPGDPRLIEGMVSRLNDKEIFVRREATNAIQLLAAKGDQKAVGALIMKLKDPDERIRASSMQGLAAAGSRGDRKVIQALMERMQTEGRNLRKTAVEAMAALIEAEDYESLAMLLQSFDDPDDTVKNAGVSSVLSIVSRGDATVIKMILQTSVKHEDRKVRAAAMRALEGLALPGDRQVVEGMISCVYDPHPQVRKSGADALSRVANRGDPDVINALSKLLEDSGSDVRKAAIEGLIAISERNSPHVIKAITGKMGSTEWHVRTAAQEALLKLCDQGDPETLQQLRDLLKHDEAHVREATVLSLSRLAKKCVCRLPSEKGCTCAVMDWLLERSEDVNAKVRQAVIESFSAVGNRRDRRLAEVLRKRTKDGDFNVKNAAETALKMFG